MCFSVFLFNIFLVTSSWNFKKQHYAHTLTHFQRKSWNLSSTTTLTHSHTHTHTQVTTEIKKYFWWILLNNSWIEILRFWFFELFFIRITKSLGRKTRSNIQESHVSYLMNDGKSKLNNNTEKEFNCSLSFKYSICIFK